jgi:large subunit ribosomal protein L32
MAVPKKRKSKARVRTRRSHDALTPKTLGWCGHCGEPKEPHRVCLSCGTYNGKQMLRVQ